MSGRGFGPGREDLATIPCLKADFDGVVAKVFLKRFENVTAKAERDGASGHFRDRGRRQHPGIPGGFFTSQSSRLTSSREQAKPVIELTAVPGGRFPARITEARARPIPPPELIEAKLVFAPPHDLTVLPGMTAKVIAQVQPDAPVAGAFRVPSNALGSDPDGKAFVWRLDPKTMTVSKVQVTIDQASGSMVEVSGELTAADEIVISGVRQLQPGMKVRRWQGTDSGQP